MTPTAILFDLDGTLLDTLGDIADAANDVLAREGFPDRPEAAYRGFIGDGVAMLFRRALPPDRVDAATVDRCVAGFHETYARTWNVRTRPYDGIPELLDALANRGLALAVLSNKPDDFTRLYGEAYLGRWPFRAIVGHREGIAPKPDPASAREIADRLGIDPRAFLYVGDTGVDMRTARGAGMVAVGVSWGFRPAEELREAGAEVVIDRPADLLGLLDGKPSR